MTDYPFCIKLARAVKRFCTAAVSSGITPGTCGGNSGQDTEETTGRAADIRTDGTKWKGEH